MLKTSWYVIPNPRIGIGCWIRRAKSIFFSSNVNYQSWIYESWGFFLRNFLLILICSELVFIKNFEGTFPGTTHFFFAQISQLYLVHRVKQSILNSEFSHFLIWFGIFRLRIKVGKNKCWYNFYFTPQNPTCTFLKKM